MENYNPNSEVHKEKNIKDELSTSQNLLDEDVVEALREEVERRGLKNFKLDISSGSDKGDNFMGIVVKIKVTGKNTEGDEVEWNWIAKVAPQTEVYRKFLKIDIAYAREVYMYQFFERMRTFQEEKGILHPFNAHPKFILSYLKPHKESFVMEDLKVVGFVMRDRKDPLDLNHVRIVMKEYGRFHAISFALRDQKPEEFEVFSNETRDRFFIPKNEEELEWARKQQGLFKSKILSAMNEKTDAEAIQSLMLYCDNLADINIKTLSTTTKYSVIGHGDSWVNNMLWKYEKKEDPTIPTQVCILDWQLARFGSPALDLSYFFYACTDQEFREKYYDQMIKLYYYTLCEHLAELGSNPQKLFPYNAFEDELKRYCIFGFYMACNALQLMVSNSSEVPEFGKSENEEDYGNALNYKSANEHVFKKRARGAALHMQQKGYFDFLKDVEY